MASKANNLKHNERDYTMNNTKYNGWTNYETWNANLCIDNDWKMSEHIALMTADMFSSDDDIDNITFNMGERIRDIFIDNMPELEPSFYSDVMAASLREVNFYEIASHYVTNEQAELEAEERT